MVFAARGWQFSVAT